MASEAALAHWRLMAAYNGAANRRLYAACALLDDRARKRDRAAAFGSIHGTLNHLMVGDLIWMARLEGGEAPSTGLGAELYSRFAALARARQALDRRIAAFFAALDAAALGRDIAYVNNQGRRFRDPLSLLLPHFFNHQTHHRGQVHALLSQAGVEAPVLDLHRVLKPDP
ncbi:MAG: DinB family protein [Reyranellaceae bacterium]